MTDLEIIAAQQKAIEKLQKRVKRLVRRMKEKKKYEHFLLLNSGATPKYMAEIDERDRKAMEE